MARMVRRPSALTATLVIIRMRARRMATGDPVTSQTASSLESARGGDGDSVTDFTVTDFMVTTVTDLMVTTVTDLMVVGSPGADSTVGRDLEIGQASPTVADSAVDFLAVEVAASQAAAFTAAEASTEVEEVSMAAVAVDSMEAAADMAVATGN
jgi:hypothetical protein